MKPSDVQVRWWCCLKCLKGWIVIVVVFLFGCAGRPQVLSNREVNVIRAEIKDVEYVYYVIPENKAQREKETIAIVCSDGYAYVWRRSDGGRNWSETTFRVQRRTVMHLLENLVQAGIRDIPVEVCGPDRGEIIAGNIGGTYFSLCGDRARVSKQIHHLMMSYVALMINVTGRRGQ